MRKSVCYNKTVRQEKAMKTKVRTFGGLPIEEPVLDDEGQRRQKQLSNGLINGVIWMETVLLNTGDILIRG